MDHYHVLGVNRLASNHEIKRAYRQAAFKYHPDRNQSNVEQATYQFQKIQEAYEVLSDELQRKQYDLSESYRNGGNGRRDDHSDAQNSYGGWDSDSSYSDYGGQQESRQSHADGGGDRQFSEVFSDLYSFESQRQTHFESKDSFLAIFLVFIGHLSFDKILSLSQADQLKHIAILGGVIMSGLLIRGLMRLLFHKVLPDRSEGFFEIFIFNLITALWISKLCESILVYLQPEFVLLPLTPSLLIAAFCGLAGAVVGRAFASAGSVVVGIIAGAFAGAILAALMGVWVILSTFMASLPSFHNSHSIQQAYLALLIGVAAAGGLGSITLKNLYFYSLLDWAEYLFDYFRPRARSTNVEVAKDQDI